MLQRTNSPDKKQAFVKLCPLRYTEWSKGIIADGSPNSVIPSGQKRDTVASVIMPYKSEIPKGIFADQRAFLRTQRALLRTGLEGIFRGRVPIRYAPPDKGCICRHGSTGHISGQMSQRAYLRTTPPYSVSSSGQRAYLRTFGKP